MIGGLVGWSAWGWCALVIVTATVAKFGACYVAACLLLSVWLFRRKEF